MYLSQIHSCNDDPTDTCIYGLVVWSHWCMSHGDQSSVYCPGTLSTMWCNHTGVCHVVVSLGYCPGILSSLWCDHTSVCHMVISLGCTVPVHYHPCGVITLGYVTWSSVLGVQSLCVLILVLWSHWGMSHGGQSWVYCPSMLSSLWCDHSGVCQMVVSLGCTVLVCSHPCGVITLGYVTWWSVLGVLSRYTFNHVV